MTRINTFAAALFAAGALGLAVPAVAQDVSYPRVVGSGQNATVEYGPGPARNIVGGGAASTVVGLNGRERTVYLDGGFVQQPPQGQVPVTVGVGENASTVWVPATTQNQPRFLAGRVARQGA